MDVTDLTVYELSWYLKKKELSPVELAEAYISRINQLNPSLNAFITVSADHALNCARAAENDIMLGHYKGSLHGIPVGLKDLFWTKGIPTTSGSLLNAHFIPAENSTVASRIEDAGGYCIGKLHMTEFAFDGTSLNHHYGVARNPWDTSRMAGGSSSGPGVAVASHQVPIAIGTDTGGSVRVPASLCGITAIKPTFGLISRYGATPLSWSMDHVGPMGRTVRDVALCLDVLVGHDVRDPDSVRSENSSYSLALDKRIDNYRIGIPKEFIWDIMDPAVKRIFDVAVSNMESLGIKVEEISVPDLGLINMAGSVVQTSEAAAIYRSRVLESGDQFDPVIRLRMESGLFISAEEYLQAQQSRNILRNMLLQELADFDFIMTPTTAIAAPKIEQTQTLLDGQQVPIREALLRITRIFSTVGFPAISVPCGFTDDGLPVGLQFVGKPFSDHSLLNVANVYQESSSWHLNTPAIANVT